MSNFDSGTKRLLFDLQATQTLSSAKRGVGRYSANLFSHVLTANKEFDIHALTNKSLPFQAATDRLALNKIQSLPELPKWDSKDLHDKNNNALDAICYSSFANTINPDLIHIAHPFEGFNERVALPNPYIKSSEQLITATVYDLIPLHFPHHYFANKSFKQFYFSRLQWLKNADLLLAISEWTRQDIINKLGIPSDRVININGGIGNQFHPPLDKNKSKINLSLRFPLTKRIVVYAGGDEYRKNIQGAIKGFAQIPQEIRKDTTLFIICAISDSAKISYLKQADAAGLTPSEIYFTGFISEEDLLAFYGVCDAFIFPSHCEGLGLPVLEAMACGAPVIGANNSAIREIIARDDALFNSHSPESIASCLNKVLSDTDFANELRNYGLERAKNFSWSKSANLLLDAFNTTIKNTRQAGFKSAITKQLPISRMAVLTPLPPQRSGIADYNANFLPYLAHYFQIDLYTTDNVSDEFLLSAFNIFHVRDFESVANSYDVILYEFGNSEFHTHMIPLLKKFPGVVTLHDAYLSGLFSHVDFALGETSSYAREMLKAHATQARHYLAPYMNNPAANHAACLNLPCSKSILDNAIGIIAFSPFNLQISKQYYPEGYSTPFRIVPQAVAKKQKTSEENIINIREHLGIPSDAFIITTFGHMVWTKCGDLLLEAYLQLIDSQPSNIYLIFAGEFSKDEFGIQLKNTILQSKLTNNIRITGYLSNEEYNQYLQISDLAIQLRQFSRGETSKAVLDCLSYGTPVIVNNEATYKDYPDNVVIKINAQPSCNELINSLKKIIAHKELLTQYSIDGLNYVTEKHNITVCAAQYAAIIHECISRYTQSKTSEWIKTFAPILSLSKNQSYDSNLAITWLNNLRQTIFQRRRIFIDVSHIAEFDLNTGIQRVVKKITSALYCSKELEFEPIAVNLINGQLQVAKSWLTKQQLLLPHEIKELSDKPIQFRTGDYFLMLDSSWNRYSEFSTVFKQARNASVPIITVIYDLIPLHLKGTLNIVEGGAEWFEGFFHKAIANSDMLLCISRTVADEVVSYLEQHTQENLRRSKINVDYWHLGADFRSTEIGNFSSRVEEIFSTSSPYLLMVGTIEPRKSHALALEVMEKLWEKDTSLNLCIAGKQGWLVDDLMAKLRLHPFRNIKLFLIEEPTDDEIAALYQNAAALLFLSKMEGFGLPLVEAANYGTPIICSDIPVFREICSEHATYVNIDDKEQLIEQLLAWHEKYKTKNLPDTSKISVLTWEQSAESMVDTITNNQYHWTSNNDYKNIEVV